MLALDQDMRERGDTESQERLKISMKPFGLTSVREPKNGGEKNSFKCSLKQFISKMACTSDIFISIQKTTRKCRFISDENINETQAGLQLIMGFAARGQMVTQGRISA